MLTESDAFLREEGPFVTVEFDPSVVSTYKNYLMVVFFVFLTYTLIFCCFKWPKLPESVIFLPFIPFFSSSSSPFAWWSPMLIDNDGARMVQKWRFTSKTMKLLFKTILWKSQQFGDGWIHNRPIPNPSRYWKPEFGENPSNSSQAGAPDRRRELSTV